ncbi:hypothetical protein [Vibrio harveyi]|uniref:hypothetical protein n=1 Tax=Vibrio harveyi TaxID=669 RepID=UPI003D753F2B
MKPDLDKLSPSDKKQILEALFRLKRNSHDFEILLNFMESCLEERKVILISADIERVQKIQGEAEILKGLFELIASSEYMHLNQ